MPGRGSGDIGRRTEVYPKAMKVIIHMRRDIQGVSICIELCQASASFDVLRICVAGDFIS